MQAMVTNLLHEEHTRPYLDLRLALHLVNQWPTATARHNQGIETISETISLMELLQLNGLMRPPYIRNRRATAMERFVRHQAVQLIGAHCLAMRNPTSHPQRQYPCRLTIVRTALPFSLHLLVLVADPPLPTVVHETFHTAALHPIEEDVRRHHRPIMARLVSTLILAHHHLIAMSHMVLAPPTTGPQPRTRLLTVLHHLFARTTVAQQHIPALNASTT